MLVSMVPLQAWCTAPRMLIFQRGRKLEAVRRGGWHLIFVLG
jgi:hypothetical protein